MKCVALMVKAEDGQSTTTHNDVDSEVSFEEDADDEIDTTLIEEEEEDWIEYIKRSTEDAMEKMGKRKDSMLEQDSQKMKWKLALRIATSPSDRWLRKAADRNPELSTRYRTNRAIGSNNQTNKTWINIAKDRGKVDSSRRSFYNDRFELKK